jgi:DNA-binding IclR family transcriptional regulator
MPRPNRAPARPAARTRGASPTPARDPLYNQSVEKAFAILGAYTGERRALGLEELAAAAGMTVSSAQRCVHTLVRLGLLRRDADQRGWSPTAKTLSVGYGYLAGNHVIEQATTHLVDLNQACEESVSLSEPDDVEMVFVARFPSHKRFLIHMPVGRRLPMYCTAAARGSARDHRPLRARAPDAAHAGRCREDRGSRRRGPRTRLRVGERGVLPRRPYDRGTDPRPGRPAGRGREHLGADQPLDAQRAARTTRAAAPADRARRVRPRPRRDLKPSAAPRLPPSPGRGYSRDVTIISYRLSIVIGSEPWQA